jgi:hypothetical protein
MVVLVALVGLFYAYLATTIFCVVLAFFMQFLFPVFMKIVEIPWPTWVIAHADRFTSWFIFFITVKLLIGTFIPIKPEVKPKR